MHTLSSITKFAGGARTKQTRRAVIDSAPIPQIRIGTNFFFQKGTSPDPLRSSGEAARTMACAFGRLGPQIAQ